MRLADEKAHPTLLRDNRRKALRNSIKRDEREVIRAGEVR